MLDNLSLLQLAPMLNVQLLIDGLFIGAIFALAAYGLALVWGVMNVKNLSQGEFVIMGGYFAWYAGMVPVMPQSATPFSSAGSTSAKAMVTETPPRPSTRSPIEAA